VDDETGEVLDTATRKSSRNATVASKKQLHSKLKDELEKRVCVQFYDLSPFHRQARPLSLPSVFRYTVGHIALPHVSQSLDRFH
jgi:hypothetical protein